MSTSASFVMRPSEPESASSRWQATRSSPPSSEEEMPWQLPPRQRLRSPRRTGPKPDAPGSRSAFTPERRRLRRRVISGSPSPGRSACAPALRLGRSCCRSRLKACSIHPSRTRSRFETSARVNWMTSTGPFDWRTGYLSTVTTRPARDAGRYRRRAGSPRVRRSAPRCACPLCPRTARRAWAAGRPLHRSRATPSPKRFEPHTLQKLLARPSSGW